MCLETYAFGLVRSFDVLCCFVSFCSNLAGEQGGVVTRGRRSALACPESVR